ncbi:hypothetical protein AB0J52_12345, partial [Spirillospora sp. NPDC049652]
LVAEAAEQRPLADPGRRGDKAGLAVALLDARERDLQEAVLSGPAPLGPGAAPADRIEAFVLAYLDYLLKHLPLVRMSETASPGARYRIGAYRFWHLHLALLLDGDPDPEAAAHGLLAALSAEHVSALLPDLGEERLRASLVRLAGAVAGVSASGGGSTRP